MLRQTFTSQPFTYRLASDMPAGPYYSYLTTPPRIYGEEFDGGAAVAMFVNDDSPIFDVIYLLLQYKTEAWPSYLYRLHRWDATDGSYLGGLDTATGPGQHLFSQSRDGTLYAMDGSLANNVYKYSIDPTTHDLVTDGVVQFSFPSSTYSGFLQPMGYLIDNDLGLLIGGTSQNWVTVYDLATGAVKGSIPTPGYPVVVMAEDTSRCYVMTSSGNLVLVNYSTFQVLSCFRIQDPDFTSGVGTQGRSICWDRRYRRFLNWVYTPVDSTGQNTSVIGGYFPTPIPTYLTAPIPIRPPRKYQQTPILTRACGSIGEPAGATRVSLSVPTGTTVAQVNGFPANTDGDGEAIGYMDCLDSGSVTLSASATVL